MQQAMILLSDAIIPGIGPIFSTLNVARQLFFDMQESKALCDSVQSRLDTFWEMLLEMERHHTLPHQFKIADFTEIVEKFHSLVLKQAQKNLLVRVGTTPSFMAKLRECHDALDDLVDSLRLSAAAEDKLQWRTKWDADVHAMTQQIALLAASGNATRMAIGGVAESIEALTTLVHEQQKLQNQQQMVEALQAICFQLARDHKLTLPSSMPPWFFTFDDIDVEREPFRTPSTASSAMGTVHRGTWGTPHTPVVVKRMVRVVPPTQSKKLSSSSSTGTWKEADVWWRLNHPNVLRMYGACHVTQPAFIVCEHAKFGNIREYLASDRRHARSFWRLQRDVAVGLLHLRTHDVVHGNLKPSNILIGDDGRAKITDFGFSCVRTTTTTTLTTNASGDNDENNSNTASLNDTMLTEDSEISNAVVAPYSEAAASQSAPGDLHSAPSFASDISAFAVCILELLTGEASWNGRHFESPTMLLAERPSGLSDDAWELIQHMSCQDPHKRPSIQQVVTRIQRLAEDEVQLEDYYSESSSDGGNRDEDVDSKRDTTRKNTRRHRVASDGNDGFPPQQQQQLQQELQRELEDLRQKIRLEERNLEKAMERRQRVAAQPIDDDETCKELLKITASLSTKQLLRILRWGTTDEQTKALRVMDTHQAEHSAQEIFRNNGLDIVVACMKHGHSSEFRQTAIDILQSIVTAGSGLYLDAVLEHGVTQVLMGVLHYRRAPSEQRRAGQFLVLLATKSARARSFFLQNSGLELLVKLLWHEQLPLFDKHFKTRCDATCLEDMRKFLATQSESRARDGERAMEHKGNRDVALQKYTEAIVLDPRNGRLYAKRSAVYAAFRKYDHAAKDAQQCIRFLPQYGEGYFRHAIALYGLQQVAQADRAIRQGRMYDMQFFDRDRLFELTLHAPRGRDRENQQDWEVGSVEF